MDLATVLSIVQTILTAVQTLNDLKETFSFSRYNEELESLGKTLSFVQSVLVDADAKQGALSQQQTVYIQELQDAIYDAHDVVDEFFTLVKQRKAVVDTHGKLSSKVRSFLSHFSLRLHNLSRKVKDVNRKLDDIASKSSQFMSKVGNEPDRFVKPESSSFLSENDTIIGREDELEKVVGMLVDQPSNDNDDLACVVIVGMGGLGKTAFAQLVYNDPRVTTAFELKSWTCIADQDQWNLTEVLAKIVKEVVISDLTHHMMAGLEQMCSQVREQLEGKKYLLVLDDVWTESYLKWLELENILRVGASGSRILVTTRSKKTAQIVGDADQVHELQGLPEKESWRLFERMAILPRQRENHEDEELTQIGKEIVKKCSNVPLAIRVTASLLRREPRLTWLSFRDKDLADIGERDHTINDILRLSYFQLDFPLKSCFAYCAIFPKDYVIDKRMLISLWMAQGYISDEHMGEKYVVKLLQRCFFQDIEVDEWGEVRHFKMHDIFHDIAEQVAAKDICRLITSTAVNLNDCRAIRHLSYLYGHSPQATFIYKTRIRTCVCVNKSWTLHNSDKFLAGNSLSNWTCLRSLDLNRLSATSLPESIGELLHLRWLNLSRSRALTALPDSITKLVNLQTLDLSDCFSLRELPNDVSKLLELTTLNLTNCTSLRHMPSGLGLLTHLHTLGMFVVGQESSKCCKKQCLDALESLRSMTNLKGLLEVRIWIHNILSYVKDDDHDEGAYLMNKERLTSIYISFRGREVEEIEREQAMLEEMQPHRDVKELQLSGYNGEILPRWLGREDGLALNVVTLNISRCLWLRCLTPLGKLPHLKDLKLEELPSVEYVVNVKLEALGSSKGSLLFPSLERLKIRGLMKLKGWFPRSGLGTHQKRRVVGVVVSVPVPCFSVLKEVHISDCPNLKSIPMCSTLKVVKVPYHQAVWSRTVDKLRCYLHSLISSDSNLRIVSFDDFESKTENNNIDAELTIALQWWISTQGLISDT